MIRFTNKENWIMIYNVTWNSFFPNFAHNFTLGVATQQSLGLTRNDYISISYGNTSSQSIIGRQWGEFSLPSIRQLQRYAKTFILGNQPWILHLYPPTIWHQVFNHLNWRFICQCSEDCQSSTSTYHHFDNV
jgi:hypothetical protein